MCTGRLVCLPKSGRLTDGAVAPRAFGAQGSKLLLDARRLQLNGTGIRATTVDPGLAETEFSVVRFKCDVAWARKVYEGTRPLTAEDIAAKKCASPHIGERFGENSVGGKCLISAVLRIPLTLLGRRQGAVGG